MAARAKEAKAAKGALVTVRPLSRELGVSVWIVYAWVRANRIPHIRAGRAIKFSRPAIAEWLRTGRMPVAGTDVSAGATARQAGADAS